MGARAVIPGPWHRRARDLFATLGELRRQRRTTHAALAVTMGCSVQQLFKLFGGLNEPSLAQFMACCDALGASAAGLLAEPEGDAYRQDAVRFAEAYMAINLAGPGADRERLGNEHWRAHDAFLRAYRARREATIIPPASP